MEAHVATPSASDSEIRRFVYQSTVSTGRVPSPLDVAIQFDTNIVSIEAAFDRLAKDHDALVLLPGSHYIWMAEPFSAVPTDFPVEHGGRRWYGNCVWDALAVAALLGGDSVIPTACPVSGTPLTLRVRDQQLEPNPGIASAVKPCNWWRSIGFT